MKPFTATIVFSALLFSLAFGEATAASESILDRVRERGYVKCAIGNRLVGDTRIGETGYEGFFPEFCRVVALALFGDRNAVEMSPTLIRYGLQSVSEGEVDIYVSNVTWTFSRDMSLKLTPAAVLYYDGQGFMSHRGTVQGALTELSDATVCVSRATTTIGNLEDYIALHGLSWRIEAFESSQGRNDAFFSRRCDLLTTDRFALATMRSAAMDDPYNYVLHDEIISKEPLVAYVSAMDMMWGNVVRWAIFATILAEEKGITSKNYRDHLESRDPVARRLLGVDESPGSKAVGLSPYWARNVISGAGNYGEIFDRYLGEGSEMKMKRGANRLWKDGGLLYTPPFR
ncbi:transporter substrate-binding domain-containing protein [Stappia sp. GBMRC 2046]|uniref:Transporter substrate-binding domain-containing protein n=1 Tax=Stappia sediminis TaxID=2692190 RepID=A0A7X3LR51_9HYPH|nr:transporter substrate-binding domain-containing protein [Stappia sediminis]MXN63558.1 transporter substrate-binding domain-containing protein [Stappia sediminis]